jgi:hypothetical protein
MEGLQETKNFPITLSSPWVKNPNWDIWDTNLITNHITITFSLSGLPISVGVWANAFVQICGTDYCQLVTLYTMKYKETMLYLKI